MLFQSEATWESFRQNVHILLGYEGSPSWNLAVQEIPWELREDFEEGVDPELTAWVLARGAMFDWRGVGDQGELEYNVDLAQRLLIKSPNFRRDVWERVKDRGRDLAKTKYEDAEIVSEFVHWELSYRDVSEAVVNRPMKRGPFKGYRLIELKPELNNRQEQLLRAFNELNMFRQAGMSGPAKIELSDILDYSRSGICSIPPDILVTVVTAADNAYLKWWQENKQTSQ